MYLFIPYLSPAFCLHTGLMASAVVSWGRLAFQPVAFVTLLSPSVIEVRGEFLMLFLRQEAEETRCWGRQATEGHRLPQVRRVFILRELPGAAVSAGSGLLQKSCFHNGWFPAAPGKAGLGSLCVCVCVFL